jgi:hypothetical protein
VSRPVRDLNGEGHAVLTVKTDHGDFMLDNLSDEIRPWTASSTSARTRTTPTCGSASAARRGPRRERPRRIKGRQAAERHSPPSRDDWPALDFCGKTCPWRILSFGSEVAERVAA